MTASLKQLWYLISKIMLIYTICQHSNTTMTETAIFSQYVMTKTTCRLVSGEGQGPRFRGTTDPAVASWSPFFVWFQSYWLIQHLSIASWHQEVNTKYQNMKLNSYNPVLRHFMQTAYFQFQRDVRKIWKSYFKYFVTFYMDDIFLSISE